MTIQEKIAALEDARARIADPAHWCRHYYATDKDSWVSATSEKAVAWCMVGTIARTLGVHTTEGCVQAKGHVGFAALTAEVGKETRFFIASFNDVAAHHEVLEAFDRAIARLKVQVA